MQITEVKFTVPDGLGGTKTIKVGQEREGIFVHLEGTGCMEMDDCAPVYIEFYDGRPRVIVWDDINDPDPVVMELDKALESNRKSDTEE